MDARQPTEDAFACSAGAVRHLSCNSVTQAGCDFGEKCAMLLECETPLLQRYACVEEGQALPGAACARGPAGPRGFDDCIAGFHCFQDQCHRICDSGPPDGCREEFEPFGVGEYCTTFDGLFTDTIGVCIDACDPGNDELVDGELINSDCAPDESCFSNTTLAAAVCLRSSPAPARKQ